MDTGAQMAHRDVTCIENSSDQQQVVLMQIIYNMDDTPMVRLATDQYGHKVVKATLEGSSHKQTINTLGSAVLVKQEKVMETAALPRRGRSILRSTTSLTAPGWTSMRRFPRLGKGPLARFSR